MSEKTKKILKYTFIILIMVAFLSINVVYAATKSDLKFCDYAGTRRTLKILGISSCPNYYYGNNIYY